MFCDFAHRVLLSGIFLKTADSMSSADIEIIPLRKTCRCSGKSRFLPDEFGRRPVFFVRSIMILLCFKAYGSTEIIGQTVFPLDGPVKHDMSFVDPVGIPSYARPEIRRYRKVIVDIVETEHDIPHSAILVRSHYGHYTSAEIGNADFHS